MTEMAERTAGDRRRATFIVAGAILFVAAAILGAYLDWLWWPVYSGLMITIAAGLILIVAGLLALAGRGTIRRVALLGLAIGVGLVAGQNLGPSREPLIHQFGGTITMRLESPWVAVASGPADCTNVASATEFQVSGDPNLRLDNPGSDFVSIYLNVGDRWAAQGDAMRKDGLHLSIGITPALVPDEGKPTTIAMVASEASSVTSTFANEGGSIRFSGLVAQTGPDFSGESMDLAGKIEWTCGEVLQTSVAPPER